MGRCLNSFATPKLDASTPFVNATPKFNLNQFGGSFGGPIQKDKTFFFADYAAKMQRKGVPFTGVVPTTAMTTPDANGDYDFNLDPFGLTRGVAQAQYGHSVLYPNLTNPFCGGRAIRMRRLG